LENGYFSNDDEKSVRIKRIPAAEQVRLKDATEFIYR